MSLDQDSLVLDRTKRTLRDGYVGRAVKWFGLLSPSDWWNDAITLGVASQLAFLYMSVVNDSRTAGMVYALRTLAELGVSDVDMPSAAFTPVRANTDPQLVALKPVQAYRHSAIQHPDVRPQRFPTRAELESIRRQREKQAKRSGSPAGMVGQGKTDTHVSQRFPNDVGVISGRTRPEDYGYTDKDSPMYEMVSDWLADAMERLQDVMDTDVSAAANDGALNVYRHSTRVKMYRRVIHPELSRSGTCGLCVAAASRTYHVSHLNPIHRRCHCTVAPIVGNDDPGFDLYQKDLDRIYKAAGGTGKAGLANLRFAVANDRELGPVIMNRSGRTVDSGIRWETPGVNMGREQIRAMLERSTLMADHIGKVLETGGQMSFTDSYGHKWVAKPPVGRKKDLLRAAQHWQQQFAASLRAELGAAS